MKSEITIRRTIRYSSQAESFLRRAKRRYATRIITSLEEKLWLAQSGLQVGKSYSDSKTGPGCQIVQTRSYAAFIRITTAVDVPFDVLLLAKNSSDLMKAIKNAAAADFL